MSPSSQKDEGQECKNMEPPPLSKSQIKKQNRRQKWLASRPERRKSEREKRKIKRKQQYADLKDGNGSEQDPLSMNLVSKKPKMMADSANKFRVVIDMDFEDFMTESEMAKSAQQVGRIYSINRHSENPCQLYISSLKGKVRDKFNFTNTGFQNWDINCSELDYLKLFENDTLKKEDFVYLSGDADDTLPDVTDILKDESKIFIIGGLVDHNRHKNLCHRRAIERGIPTAKLPIKEHVTLCQRHILSTVAVFEIMLNVLGSHYQWTEALLASIPKRKIAQSIPSGSSIILETTKQVNDDLELDRLNTTQSTLGECNAGDKILDN